jgi:hypothetical protein
MVVVLVVAAIAFNRGDPQQNVKPPIVVKIPPTTQTADTSDEPRWGFFRQIKPQK